ncbi:hypothetical protein NDU88_004771 [Pleurodeles waltl]|uniref:Uncharacterized protein n=1 Tax=Pleurodeles waltl TaxID=8319 RepID=A0AAV7SJT9_PLEWA|nr:hypothetical protein NDU88_004771 [Pleurodeles waltl]
MRAPPHAGRSLRSCRGRLHYARPRLPARGGAESLSLLRAEQLGPPLAPSPHRGLVAPPGDPPQGARTP